MVGQRQALDLLCVNTLRALAMDAVEQAKSGHPGAPMGFAAPAYVLWTRFLRHNPRNPHWPDRDRFVLSAGHASILLYALLYLTGYGLTLDDLKRFRQWGSRTPGHPEFRVTPGVECTTGPLGQGFANAVGMAIAERHLASVFNRPGYEIVDHWTYVVASDGDLMEGVAHEAASLAGHLQLGRLVCLYDANRVSLAGSTELTFTEDVAARFKALGWHVQEVADGNNLEAVEAALRRARQEMARPSLIIVRTHIGYGSPGKQDRHEAHGAPLGEEEVRRAKQNLGWPYEEPFAVPEEVLAEFRKAVPRGERLEADWRERFAAYARRFPELADQWERAQRGELPSGWDADLPSFTPGERVATRAASGKVLQTLASRIPWLVGGSADLNPSTNTALRGLGDFQSPQRPVRDAQGACGGPMDYRGRNLHFGVREHAMGAVANGIAYHGGLRPFVATFLVFSDYERPAIRLAALSGLPVVHVFTHDSVLVGEDGPTHQPVEHLASLRAIPNLVVLRPADAEETVEAWRVALEHTEGPVAIVLTRQPVPVLDRTRYAPASGLRRGGYVLADCPGQPELILIGTGSEVQLCVEAYERLRSEGVRVRVVSLPSWELFDRQPASYREQVLPPTVRRRLAVEAARPFGWERYVGCGGRVVGVDRFGASAPHAMLAEKFGLTPQAVYEAAHQLLEDGGGRAAFTPP
ncbi:MAG: transketolase [Armatimonadota bacterium]|nr:transketolase [Armatimonadota bacterium]MDW8156008.1 transketolase [Armatimonadota bacterium]